MKAFFKKYFYVWQLGNLKADRFVDYKKVMARQGITCRFVFNHLVHFRHREFFRPVPWKIRRWFQPGFLKTALHFWPMYFECWSRDCDCAESTQRMFFWCGWSYLNWLSEAHEYFEGPFSMTQITRKEYKNFKSSFRDRIAEAWDDGNTTPFNV